MLTSGLFFTLTECGSCRYVKTPSTPSSKKSWNFSKGWPISYSDKLWPRLNTLWMAGWASAEIQFNYIMSFSILPTIILTAFEWNATKITFREKIAKNTLSSCLGWKRSTTNWKSFPRAKTAPYENGSTMTSVFKKDSDVFCKNSKWPSDVGFATPPVSSKFKKKNPSWTALGSWSFRLSKTLWKIKRDGHTFVRSSASTSSNTNLLSTVNKSWAPCRNTLPSWVPS